MFNGVLMEGEVKEPIEDMEVVVVKVEGLDEEGRPQLKKNITIFRGVCLVVGTIIGSGIFVSPNNITKCVGSPAMSILVWLGGGFLAAIGGLTFAELGTMIPDSGAEVTFLKKAYSPLHRFGRLPSFLSVWLLHFLLSGARRAIAVLTFSKYFWSVIKIYYPDYESAWFDKLLCTAVLVVMITIIATKPTLALKFIVVWTTLKIGAILFIIVVGVIALFKGKTENISVGFTDTDWSPQLWGEAWNNVIWSYLGWEQICIVTGEVKNPQRNVPIIIGISVTIVTVLYMLTVLSYHVVLPMSVMRGDDAIATVFGETIGQAGVIILASSVALSTLGSFQCTLLTQSRYIHAAGVQGSLPKVFSLVSERFHTPLVAILYLGCITFVFMMIGNLNDLVNAAGFTVFPFYVLCAIGVFVMRHNQPDLHRPYRVPLVFPAMFILIGLYVFITPFINNLLQSCIWMGVMLVGVPVYFVFVEDVFGLKFSFMDRVTSAVGGFMGCK